MMNKKSQTNKRLRESNYEQEITQTNKRLRRESNDQQEITHTSSSEQETDGEFYEFCFI